jgi:hypothetical protein
MPFLTIEEMVDRRFTNLETRYATEERKQERREKTKGSPTSKKAKAKAKRLRKEEALSLSGQ